jgi:cell filamentation protein
VADPYCWPGTDCLRNTLGIHDVDELERAEKLLVALRSAALDRNPLPGRYDSAHLRRFHRELFGDVYDWAGELRTVDIHKAGTWFCRARHLASALAKLLDELSGNLYLTGLSADTFVAEFATVYGELNVLHPFREGNGRTQRAFLRQLAAAAGWRVAWEMMDPAANNRACAEYWHTTEPRVLVELLTPVVFHLGG